MVLLGSFIGTSDLLVSKWSWVCATISDWFLFKLITGIYGSFSSFETTIIFSTVSVLIGFCSIIMLLSDWIVEFTTGWFQLLEIFWFVGISFCWIICFETTELGIDCFSDEFLIDSFSIDCLSEIVFWTGFTSVVSFLEMDEGFAAFEVTCEAILDFIVALFSWFMKKMELKATKHEKPAIKMKPSFFRFWAAFFSKTFFRKISFWPTEGVNSNPSIIS